MDKLGRKIIKEFVALRPKMYDHLTDDICVDKNAAKGTKNVLSKEKLFQYYLITKTTKKV